jgi:hypothetical protein
MLVDELVQCNSKAIFIGGPFLKAVSEVSRSVGAQILSITRLPSFPEQAGNHSDVC